MTASPEHIARVRYNRLPMQVRTQFDNLCHQLGSLEPALRKSLTFISFDLVAGEMLAPHGLGVSSAEYDGVVSIHLAAIETWQGDEYGKAEDEVPSSDSGSDTSGTDPDGT